MNRKTKPLKPFFPCSTEAAGIFAVLLDGSARRQPPKSPPSPCASDACCPERSPPAPEAAAGVLPRAVQGWVPSYCVRNQERVPGWVPTWHPGTGPDPERALGEAFLPSEDLESTSSQREPERGSCRQRARLSRSCCGSWKSPRTGHRKRKRGLGTGSCPHALARGTSPRAKPLLTNREHVSDPGLEGFAKPAALGTRSQLPNPSSLQHEH